MPVMSQIPDRTVEAIFSVCLVLVFVLVGIWTRVRLPGKRFLDLLRSDVRRHGSDQLLCVVPDPFGSAGTSPAALINLHRLHQSFMLSNQS